MIYALCLVFPATDMGFTDRCVRYCMSHTCRFSVMFGTFPAGYLVFSIMSVIFVDVKDKQAPPAGDTFVAEPEVTSLFT